MDNSIICIDSLTCPMEVMIGTTDMRDKYTLK
jgi:hypothetical protein